MKEIVTKYVLIFIIVLTMVIPASVLLSTFSGCARVKYRNRTKSIPCNFAMMMAEMKSIKGVEALEVRQYIEDCYEDVARTKCEKKVYGKNITNEREKYLDFIECVKNSK